MAVTDTSTRQSEQTTPEKIESRYPIGALVDRIEKGANAVQIQGASGAFAACVLTDLSRRLQRPCVAVTPTEKAASTLSENLRLFAETDKQFVSNKGGADGSAKIDETVSFVPQFDVGPYHQASPDRTLEMRRMEALYRLSGERPPRFTVAPIRGAMRKTMAADVMRETTRRLEVGDSFGNEDLRAYLTNCGYTEVSVVEDPGTFAVRGSVVDLFVPSYDQPVRLERWGDEVSDIRSFNAETQRTLQEREGVEIFPIRQEILSDEVISRARTNLLKQARNIGLDDAFGNVRDIVSDLEAGVRFIGIDSILPALHTELEDLFDYCPDDAIFVVFSPNEVVMEATDLMEDREREFDRLAGDERLAYEVGRHYTTPSCFVEWGQSVSTRVEISEIALRPAEDELAFELPPADNRFVFRARPNTDVVKLRKQHRGIENTVNQLTSFIDEWRDRFGRICIACRTRTQVDRVAELFDGFGQTALKLNPPIDVTETVPPPAEVVEIYEGDLSDGFRSEHLSVCLLAGRELFGSRVTTHSERSVTEHAEISHFRDLTTGDHVVHVDFGIGRYQGLEHMEIEGVSNDFLCIEYADGDTLYVPVYRLKKVQKYVGGAARLDKLGGERWQKRKEQVKEQIHAIAGDLLKLYAERQMAEGFAFSPPGDYFREFENEFPFEETPDQARAIEEVLSDMMNDQPMDRLICGDVGFGKTEVAIRAAMKAVLDGKQVAVLVPTTILSEQHLITFRDRMDDFGVRVEAVSRFRSTSESRQILEDTEQGKVDVLIGTHRLLSGDVDFRDLGLLVVDEEQRFGVKHKEHIKKMRSNLDVLTLTATPIPRTLQMSMLGIRDLSIIATPPHNRLAVRTHIAKFSDDVIREALVREISRGGQVFFVHNRVETIDEMGAHVAEVVPEADIAIAHGQMPESQLEDIMYDYIQGNINVLVCSSIIESGLDIPNANTIVVNRSDLFGLSQLYQLRGRVGRSGERAYAYLLVPSNKTLSDDAKARLEVIQRHQELGSGFQVASYDMEIRGAGNLLGEDQSGHITSVGLDLYSDLLEETINDLRDVDVEEQIEPEVNIPVEAYLPGEFIPSTSLRLMFYKRMSLSRSQEELFDIFDELVDRFGQPPEPVRNLRELLAVKVGCRMIRARKLETGPSAISVSLDESTPLPPDELVELVDETNGRLRITKDMKLILSLKPDESARPLETTRNFIDRLLAIYE